MNHYVNISVEFNMQKLKLIVKGISALLASCQNSYAGFITYTVCLGNSCATYLLVVQILLMVFILKDVAMEKNVREVAWQLKAVLSFQCVCYCSKYRYSSGILQL